MLQCFLSAASPAAMAQRMQPLYHFLLVSCSFLVCDLLVHGFEKFLFPGRNVHVKLTKVPSIAMCRICEPIAFMSIFPYIYYMILSFGITSDDRQIAIYAGLVTSAFAFAEFSTGVIWGRLSDRVGRKPVLLTGLAGTLLSMVVFGLAPNLPVALLGRALGGLLNGYSQGIEM